MISKNELRPCLVDGEEGEHLFHCWSHVSEIVPPALTVGGHPGGVIAGTLGIVENREGRVLQAKPEKIRFLQQKEYGRKDNYGTLVVSVKEFEGYKELVRRYIEQPFGSVEVMDSAELPF